MARRNLFTRLKSLFTRKDELYTEKQLDRWFRRNRRELELQHEMVLPKRRITTFKEYEKAVKDKNPYVSPFKPSELKAYKKQEIIDESRKITAIKSKGLTPDKKDLDSQIKANNIAWRINFEDAFAEDLMEIYGETDVLNFYFHLNHKDKDVTLQLMDLMGYDTEVIREKYNLEKDRDVL